MSYTQKALAVASALLMGAPTAALSDTISNTDFEGGSLSDWNKGSQTGTLTNGTITGNGTGVTLVTGNQTFSAPSHPAVGSPTLQGGAANPYYSPAVTPTTWVFAPYGSYGAALQPNGNVTFDAAISALGLTQAENQAIKTKLIQDQQASGLGSPTPTNAAWLTKDVTLNAGTTYTMSWNYIGTDYVPFNDGSITSLVYQGTGSTPNVVVNNYAGNYALLGFTNPGTGDYSTGTYGSTGWQQSTYQVDVTGSYLLGFAVFNLGDTALSPVLLVDSQPGTTTQNGQTFGAVTPNNPNAPTVNPTPTPTPTPTPVTVTATSTTDQVTTSTSTGSIVATSAVTYNVSNLDADGYGTVQNYTDTVETTTPVTTTTTTTTPVTTTTYSDGSTTTSNGTPVVTTSTSNGSSTSQVIATSLNYSSVIAPSVSYATVVSGNPTVTHTPAYATSESDGKQKVNVHVTTGVTTPLLTTVTTTPVTTTTDANGNVTVTNGTPVDTYVASTTYDEYHNYRDYFGRIDQLEVMDKVNGAINGLLDHEPITNHKKRFRVFDNTRFAQSYNADDYKANTRILGGGFEYDLTKGWTAGAQYNQININLNGVDSKTHSTRQHIGIFNSFHGKHLALVTNAGASQDNYNYTRTVEGVFHNAGETTGQQWWVHNRLYANNSGWFKPFVGYTVSNSRRNAYDETGNAISARSVDASNQTTHVGEAGLKIETRFGGKKHDAFGVSVDGAYGTDNSYGVTAALDYKEIIFVEGSHGVSDGVTTNSIAGRVKFRF